jgi:hypothetical protein
MRIGVPLLAGFMALMGLCIVTGANSQTLEIHTGIDTYQKALPMPPKSNTVEDWKKALEDANGTSAGLAEVLNSVIAAWEADHADAAAKVEAIIEGNRAVVDSTKRAKAALDAIPGGALAKTLAVGVYSAGNPLGTIGGYYGGGGAAVTWNMMNLFTLNGRAGLAWSPQFHPEISLAAEWWMF